MHTASLFIRYFFSGLVIYLSLFFVLGNVKLNGTALIHRVDGYFFLKGGNSYEKFEEFRGVSNPDVLVLGSSHAYRGYDPRWFKRYNLTMFNLGTSGQTMYNTYFVARHYIKKPKVVLLDVYEGAFNGDGIEASADLIQNVDKDMVAVEIAFNLYDLRAINMLMLRLINKTKPPHYKDSTYISGGFNETNAVANTNTGNTGAAKILVSEKQWAYFIKLLQYCKQQNVKLIAVNHPSTHIANRTNHELFAARLRFLLNQYNVPFYDFAYTPDMNKTAYFYDETHLNQKGVDVFNKALIEKLRNDGIL